MKLEVTRAVVKDLWPLCRAGEASSDSTALVDAFLATDSGLASTLEESEKVSWVVPAVRLSPDAERRLLDEARGRTRLKLQIIGASAALGGLLLFAALSFIVWMFVVSRGAG